VSSPETSRIFGVDPNPGSYRVLLGKVHPDDRTAAENAYRESILDGSVRHLIQHRILTSDGAETRFVTQECHHERDASGNVVRSVGIVQDVTESKRVEEEKARRAQFDRILMEIASALVGRTVVDVDHAVYHVLSLIGEFAGAGHAHVCLYGESEDAIDKSYEWRADCVEPDGRSVCSIGIEQRIPGVNDRIRRHETVYIPDVSKVVSVEEELISALEAAQVRSLVLLPIHIGDDTLGFMGLDSAVPGREWLHEFGGLLGLVADLLASLFQRTRSEQTVRESEERMQLALEGANLGTWDWNVHTNHVIYSERWATMLGYDLDEIPPHHSTWERIVNADDLPAAMDAMTAHIEGRTDFYEVEVRLRHKDGHWVWVLARGRVIEWDADGAARRFCGTHQDVTTRRLAEDRLRVLNNRLEQIVEERTAEALHANLAKGEFLAAMSHELRTPLNSVIGFSGILLSGVAGEINGEQEKQLRMIQGSGKHLLRLVNDILDLSKIDAEAVGVDLSATDINQVCAEAAEYVRPEAVEKGLELRLVSCEEECCRDGQVMTDRGKFLQIVLNLLSNAIKFTKEGSVELRVDCSGDGSLAVVVTDTGPGIDPDALDRVFQRFEQIPVGGEAKPAGSGLGLSISRKLAGILGGTLSVESTPGVGSAFTLRLPLRFADDESE
jgi:PAS domain S-box-containing protein